MSTTSVIATVVQTTGLIVILYCLLKSQKRALDLCREMSGELWLLRNLMEKNKEGGANDDTPAGGKSI